MNLIDIVVAIVLMYGIVRGFKRGAIKEVIGLVGLVIAIWAGFRLAFIFADYYKANFDLPDNIIPFLAFFTAFGLAILAVYLIGRLLTGAVAVVQLSIINKAAGAVFGGLKWAFLLGTVLILTGSSEVLPPTMTESSATYPYLKGYTEAVNEYTVALIPAARNVFQDMDNYFQDLDSLRTLNDSLPPERNPRAVPIPPNQFPENDSGNRQL